MSHNNTSSLNSAPTLAGGYRPEVADEPSLGSAPTIAAGGGVNSPSEPILGHIDQYELIRKLGGGGFGVVYLARDTISGVDVALKTLHPLLKTNAEEMERLREKFALVSHLTHTNIAKALVFHLVHDIAVTDDAARRELRLSTGDFVMVMDYASGVTLSKWSRQFKDGKVPLPLVTEIGRQIASALDYAHGERIVHRDIKPANVVVETLPAEASRQQRVQSSEFKVQSSGGASSPSEPPKIRVRILDFGLAAEIRSSMSRVSTEEGDTSGTRPYMAPEQWTGKKQDGRTDQYALACVLYELLAGEPPFAGVFETGDPIVMRTAVERDTPDEIEGVPDAVNAALLRALAKDPNDRFPSCRAFVEALSDGFVQTPRPFWPWLLAGAAVLVLGVGLWRAGRPASHPGEPTAVSAPATSAASAAATLGGIAATTSATSAAPSVMETPKSNGGASSPSESQSISTRLEVSAHQAGDVLPVTVGQVRFNLRWCPAGSFMMGSPSSEEGRSNDEIQHRVTFTNGFWMGETEVTQGLWQDVMGANPSDSKSGDNYPVENVSWNDCQEFIAKLNSRSEVRKAGLKFSLPTEAQWEYACRAGSTGDFGGTGRMDNMGWYTSNSGSATHAVASKQANAWGLRDMHGNVWEWCQDWYGSYPTGAVTDPTGPASGDIRVLRGGSYRDEPEYCRSAYRYRDYPDFRLDHFGLRLLAFQDAQ